MSQQLELPVSVRSTSASRRGELRTNRLAGKIPAVLYGNGEPSSLWLNRKALEDMVHKAHSTSVLVQLIVEGGKTQKETALLKSIQRDMVFNTPIHADFLRVDINQKVEVSIQIHVSGESIGVKNNAGILEHPLREIKARCLASDIPAAINVDVSSLDIGQSVKVADLNIPEGVEVLTHSDLTVITVLAPKAVEEATPAVDAVAAAQPEVIAKGKKDEEGAAPAAAPAKGAAPAAKADAPKK